MRKLKLNRETLRHLEDLNLQEAAGAASTVFTQCGSCLINCSNTCNVSCGGTCQYTCIFC